MRICSVSLLLIIAAPALATQDVPAADTHLPPEVGDVAPPLGNVFWRASPSGESPKLEELRGSVVLVQTWVWYCDSCVRKGVPYVVDLRNSNGDAGLVAISLQGQNQREDVADDHWLTVADEMDMEHFLGETSYFGEYSPYFNLNSSGGTTTYCFVIGREGGVVWKGDPSSKDDEFLEAVAAALAAPAAPALDGASSEPMREATRLYVLRDYAKAAAAAEKTRDKYAKSKKKSQAELAARAVREAELLLNKIDEHRATLAQAVETAWSVRDAQALVEASAAIAQVFPKTELAKRAAALRKEARADEGFAAQLDAAEEWVELAAERPPLFPARADKDGKRYSKRLEKYVAKQPDGPGAKQATAWIERYGG